MRKIARGELTPLPLSSPRSGSCQVTCPLRYFRVHKEDLIGKHSNLLLITDIIFDSIFSCNNTQRCSNHDRRKSYSKKAQWIKIGIVVNYKYYIDLRAVISTFTNGLSALFLLCRTDKSSNYCSRLFSGKCWWPIRMLVLTHRQPQILFGR